jgi:hypothetical protein
MGRVFFPSFPSSSKALLEQLDLCVDNGTCADLMEDASQKERTRLETELAAIEAAYVTLYQIKDRRSSVTQLQALFHTDCHD